MFKNKREEDTQTDDEISDKQIFKIIYRQRVEFNEAVQIFIHASEERIFHQHNHRN